MISNIMDLNIMMEQQKPDRVGIDSFKGTMREFKLYLVVQKMMLEQGLWHRLGGAP